MLISSFSIILFFSSNFILVVFGCSITNRSFICISKVSWTRGIHFHDVSLVSCVLSYDHLCRHLAGKKRNRRHEIWITSGATILPSFPPSSTFFSFPPSFSSSTLLPYGPRLLFFSIFFFPFSSSEKLPFFSSVPSIYSPLFRCSHLSNTSNFFLSPPTSYSYFPFPFISFHIRNHPLIFFSFFSFILQKRTSPLITEKLWYNSSCSPFIFLSPTLIILHKSLSVTRLPLLLLHPIIPPTKSSTYPNISSVLLIHSYPREVSLLSLLTCSFWFTMYYLPPSFLSIGLTLNLSIITSISSQYPVLSHHRRPIHHHIHLS